MTKNHGTDQDSPPQACGGQWSMSYPRFSIPCMRININYSSASEVLGPSKLPKTTLFHRADLQLAGVTAALSPPTHMSRCAIARPSQRSLRRSSLVVVVDGSHGHHSHPKFTGTNGLTAQRLSAFAFLAQPSQTYRPHVPSTWLAIPRKSLVVMTTVHPPLRPHQAR